MSYHIIHKLISPHQFGDLLVCYQSESAVCKGCWFVDHLMNPDTYNVTLCNYVPFSKLSNDLSVLYPPTSRIVSFFGIGFLKSVEFLINR